jgi:hypothetical protein
LSQSLAETELKGIPDQDYSQDQINNINMSKFKNEDENSSKVNKKINKNKQILNDKNNIQK